MMVPGCISGLIFLGLVVYLNRALWLLMAFRKQLRQVLELARRNWNDVRPSAPPIRPVADA